MHLYDTFKESRYKVYHNLGYGGFSTVWLARDEHLQRFVSMKVLSAGASRTVSELSILRQIDKCASAHPLRKNIVSILDTFNVEGPNGIHECHVSPVAGPSLFNISDSPGQIEGFRPLKRPIVRKLARELAKTVSWLHSINIIHGGEFYGASANPTDTSVDITTKNVLLQLCNIDNWTIDDVYEQLGQPVWDEVFTASGGDSDASAPDYIVQPTSFDFLSPRHIKRNISLIDFGEAFLESSPPPNGVGTPAAVSSPELLLQRKASRWSDAWALVCTRFGLRAGYDVFGSFVGSPGMVLGRMARLLGPMPDDWWPLLEKYDILKGGRDCRSSIP